MRKTLSSLSPRARLLAAGALLLGLTALGPLGGLSISSVARGLLGALALGGLGWWLRRRGASEPDVPRLARMQVISRTGLSPRCGLALVEVDGRGYLVAFGDSFAEIRETQEPEDVFARALAQARRPMPKRRVPGRSKGVGR
ncbi:flagellar biosynthetic protein FliO [Pyxidicoccus parkwayensis]|uniref:Flagellar biosynthetic protein FliO n=1 Tax=Pyxidicoccus parkwayensis TaxID=2813578 RepID=A0ABX7P076_9BACT|nr:flagellar biosynthetic protein FliO [Pyxidicoccus parkwaysis]QSQ23994.1 flagellar biosynthetic protein FliO [Pyxidicoccus parkwaysis]